MALQLENPITVLENFPGFAVQYNPQKHEYFKKNMEDTLTQVMAKGPGKDLLKDINASKPEKTFANGIKCVFQPMDVVYHPPKKLVKPPLGGCHPLTGDELEPEDHDKLFVIDRPDAPDVPYVADSVAVQSIDLDCSSNGKGAVCYLYFSNAYFIDSKGNKAPHFIALAHELIHVLNHCTGTLLVNQDEEEKRTVGLGQYADLKYTENKFRDAYDDIKPREQY